MDSEYRQRIRRARGSFAAMATTYGLGVFNDSFFRQSTMLLAVSIHRDDLQGWILALFSLPYVIAAPQAGWLADRFSKRHVVILAKAMELLAMSCGAVGILTGMWGFIIAMVFTMGLQSCLFSPALNGSIPELYPAEYVSRANSMLKVVTTAMILGGVSVAGIILDVDSDSVVSDSVSGVSDVALRIVAIGIVSISFVGLLVSFAVPSRPAADPQAKFPWRGHGETFATLREAFRDKLLWTVICVDAYVWFSGSLIVPLTNVMAKQFGWSKTVGSAMLAAELIGMAAGGLIGGRLDHKKRWWRILLPGLGAMIVPLLCILLLAGRPVVPVGLVLFAAIGIAGGLVMIPCEAFIQVRPSPQRRGATIAAANFVIFTGIVLSGPISALLLECMAATTAIACMALPTAIMAIWLVRRMGVISKLDSIKE